MFEDLKVLVRSGGDLASAVVQKLHRSGFKVVISELEHPMMVRRTVSFSNSVYTKRFSVEGIEAVYVKNQKELEDCLSKGSIPVTTLSEEALFKFYRPSIFIDATLSKKPVEYKRTDFDIVIGLGPEIEAGVNADAVIETCRGHDLGRILFKGFAKKNTSIPGFIDGYAKERVLRAPCDGHIVTEHSIGDMVKKHDVIMTVDSKPVLAQIDGVIRGLIHPNTIVREGLKIGDIDPRGTKDYCYTISDKGRNIAGAVLEAVLYLLRKENEN